MCSFIYLDNLFDNRCISRMIDFPSSPYKQVPAVEELDLNLVLPAQVRF